MHYHTRLCSVQFFCLIADIIGRIIVYLTKLIWIDDRCIWHNYFPNLARKVGKIMQMSTSKKYTGRYSNLYVNFYLLVGLDFDIFEYQFQSRFKNLFLYY